jgi:TaqI-like C-terminal specificity domain
MLKGEDVSRYDVPNFKYYCIYPYKFVGGKTIILQEHEFSLEFPLAYQYLRQYRQELRWLRTKFKTNPQYWYSCHRSRSIADFDHDRIITPEISLGCNMTYSQAGIYHNTKVYSLIPPPNRLEHQRYWLGILNPKMLWWFLANTGYVLRGGYFVFKTHYLRPFPIRLINFASPTDRAIHDQVVELVEYTLQLHQQMTTARTGHEQTAVQRQIEAIDRQIDQLVYQLYGLTAEEVNIVEQATR